MKKTQVVVFADQATMDEARQLYDAVMFWFMTFPIEAAIFKATGALPPESGPAAKALKLILAMTIANAQYGSAAVARAGHSRFLLTGKSVQAGVVDLTLRLAPEGCRFEIQFVPANGIGAPVTIPLGRAVGEVRLTNYFVSPEVYIDGDKGQWQVLPQQFLATGWTGKMRLMGLTSMAELRAIASLGHEVFDVSENGDRKLLKFPLAHIPAAKTSFARIMDIRAQVTGANMIIAEAYPGQDAQLRGAIFQKLAYNSFDGYPFYLRRVSRVAQFARAAA